MRPVSLCWKNQNACVFHKSAWLTSNLFGLTRDMYDQLDIKSVSANFGSNNGIEEEGEATIDNHFCTFMFLYIFRCIYERL